MKNILLPFTIISTLICNGQVTFTNMASLLQPVNGSYGNLASDMNGDHLDDIVRVTANGIYSDYQQAAGGFQAAYFPMSIANLPSWSICAADIDANGYNDLCLGAGNAVSFVYANDNGTGYTEVAHPEYIFTQRTTFADIDNDGNLDAFANHDVDQCHPYRNVSGELVLDFSLIQTLDAGGNYAAIGVDYDNDWDQDLYITKCRGGAAWGDAQRINLLYKNNGDGTFTESGAEANLNDGNQSWVTCFEDFDNDGDFDAFIVNHYSGDVPGGSANKFMRNNGDGTFTDIIASTGINAEDLGAWNADAWDFDNNGFVDIYSEMGTNWYWNNGDGTFASGPSTGFTRAGIGDFNNDGYLDAISGNSLWMNDGSQNHYIKFSLEGILSNRSAIGARIEIYGDFGMQVREVRSGESFSPGSSLTEHFGIGTYTSIDQVIIKWPSQQVTTINNPAIDQTHFILEASCMNPPIAIAAQGSTEICPGQSV
ncbi:MAG: CRTAC1 family protein, partial [Flavobacteriales bacterium]